MPVLSDLRKHATHRWLACVIGLGMFVAGCSESAPPAPTPPVTPPPVAPPAPTPPRPSTTLDVSRGEGGTTSLQGRNGLLAQAAASFNVTGLSAGGHPGRMYAEANVNAGVHERPISRSTVHNSWSSTAGDYRISADVNWSGQLGGQGVVGAGASVAFVLEVRDFSGRLLASQMLHEREIRESGLTVGGVTDVGRTSAAVDFTLPANTGGPFQIRFVLTCEATSGVVGVLAFCLFGNDPTVGPPGSTGDLGHAEWTRLSVTEFR